MKNILLTGAVYILSWSTLMAQDCLNNLEEATAAYYNGRFNVVLDLLSGCDYDQLDKSSKADVLELVIKARILLDNAKMADSLMNELLISNPLYNPRSSDILLYRELYESYELINPWNFGLISGINVPEFQIMRYQSIGSVTQEPETYNPSLGLAIGLRGERTLIRNLYLNLGLVYQNYGYSYSEIILDYQQLDVEETLHSLDIPLNLRYVIDLGSFKPFINAGASAQFVIKSELGLDLRTIATEIPVPYAGIPQKTNDYNSTNQRKPLVFNYIVGGGIRKELGTLQLELALNYQFGLNNLINSEARLTDSALIDTYAYVPDDIKLNNFIITLGVYKSILRPKKIQ